MHAGAPALAPWSAKWLSADARPQDGYAPATNDSEPHHGVLMHLRAFAGLVALTTASCSGTEPIELASSYTISTVEGAAPPQLVGATVECDVSVGGGRLTFGPAEQFDLGLDVLIDCSRGGGSTSESTYGYTGTAAVEGRRVTFHTARASGPLVFEGQGSSSGRLEVVVPFLVPTVDEVSVGFLPN
jgi:hypothetical protein